MAHETTNTTKIEKYYINHFDALNSISDKTREAFKKINTDALIEVFGTYDKTADKEWLEGSIETALKEKDKAKQIYTLAETLRLEYIEASLKDVDDIAKTFRNCEDKRQKNNVDFTCNYLTSTLYNIDLFEVAKELIARYKNGTLFSNSAN